MTLRRGLGGMGGTKSRAGMISKKVQKKRNGDLEYKILREFLFRRAINEEVKKWRSGEKLTEAFLKVKRNNMQVKCGS